MPNRFETFSFHHFAALLVFALFTLLVIWFGLNSDRERKLWIGFGIAFIAFAFMLFDSIYRLVTNTYNVLTDLPFFLCDFVVIILPWVIWKQKRKWIGILYFWAVAGTLQALLTPELDQGFPEFEFFRYFIMHGGIVTAVAYHVIVFRIRIGWKDFWNAILYAQFYLIAVHMINLILRSNYSYTMAKPRSQTILDLMGPWPWYVLVSEILMVMLFLLLLIPFLVNRRKFQSIDQELSSGE
jgi:hypothetical integral membrane protein (TIGR02206 family)